MMTVFGIKSCDTCRKARKFFVDHDIEFRFHDVREDGLDKTMLKRWTSKIEWTKLLNKQSLTWRKIPEVDRNGITEVKAIGLMLENPTLIKRPVLESDAFFAVGFSEKRFSDYLAGTGRR